MKRRTTTPSGACRYSDMARVHACRGTVLIVTIWVVLVLAGLALVFARSVRVMSQSYGVLSIHKETGF